MKTIKNSERIMEGTFKLNDQQRDGRFNKFSIKGFMMMGSFTIPKDAYVPDEIILRLK